MFWFNRKHPNVIYADNRDEKHTLCDGRNFEISPDVQMDFRQMNFEDETFNLVVFDPPHLKVLGKDSWMAKKYGRLTPHWEDDIKQGFKECWRVLKPMGVLIFKWNETDIKIKDVLKLLNVEPLFGHTTTHRNTIWLCFMKIPNDKNIIEKG